MSFLGVNPTASTLDDIPERAPIFQPAQREKAPKKNGTPNMNKSPNLDPDSTLSRAEQGDVESQLIAGWALYCGQSLPLDKERGLGFLKSASDAGSLRAAFRLAYIRELAGDPDCVRMFEELAKRQYSPALYELGNIWWEGKLVKLVKTKGL